MRSRVGVPIARPVSQPWFATWPTFVEESAYTANGGVIVTAHATPHTKGSWTELIAATTADCDLAEITGSNVATAATDTNMLLDIGIGAAASEVVLLANIPVGSLANAVNSATPVGFHFPVRIPRGTRIAARCQGTITVDTVKAGVRLYRTTGGQSPKTVDTYGADTATSGGTVLATGDSYTQITAGSSRAYRALVVVPTAIGTAMSSLETVMSLGVGAAAAEVTVGATSVITTNAEVVAQPRNHLGAIFPGHYPAGIRIAVKQAAANTTIAAVVFGIPYS